MKKADVLMATPRSSFRCAITAGVSRLAACLAVGLLICIAPAQALEHAKSPTDSQDSAQAAHRLDRFLDYPEVQLQTQRWGISAAEVREQLSRLSDSEKAAIAQGLKRFSAPTQAERTAAADTMYLLTALLLKDALLFSRIVSVYAGSFPLDQ